MILTPIRKQLWLGLSLSALLVACGGPGKPSVSLTATPTALDDGQIVTLKADAKGGQGALKVEFYKGTDKVGEDSSSPYELSYTVSTNDDATFLFTAKAIAADNQFGVSEPVNVQVKADKTAPQVSLSASSSNLNSAGSVTLTATATDNKGVVKVEFFKGANKLGEDTTAADGFKMVVNLTADDNGSLKYSAKAYDAKGNVGTSAEVGVSVDIRGSLAVSINGLPSGTNANVAVTGPDSYSQNLTANATLDNLKPGSYTLTPAIVKDNNYSYAAESSSVAVAGGSTANGTVSYSAITSALTVTISGLPNGTNGDVNVTGPDGYSKNLTTTTTLNDLKPGDYTLTPAGVEGADYSFTATASTVSVTKGNIANGAVAYSATNGALTLTISGLPSGTDGSVKVDGPNGFSQTFTATTTLKKLPAGDYTLTPATLDSGDYSYAAASSTVSVSNGNTANGAAAYAPTSGALTVTITNLPAGEKVTVSGPNSFSTELTATATLKKLSAGDYTIAALDVAGYTKTISGSPASVVVGNTAAASVGFVDDIAPSVSVASSSAKVIINLVSNTGSATLTATASDVSGIEKVEFYEGATLLFTDSDGSDGYKHSLSYTTANDGTHTYKAKAYDTKGNSAEATVDVEVKKLSSVPTFVAGDHNRALAIKTDGTLAHWNMSSGAAKTVPSGLSGVVSVAITPYTSLLGETNMPSMALKSDGTVVIWNESGATFSNPSGLSGVVAIGGGESYYSLALKSDGTLVAWNASGGASMTLPSLSGVKAISVGKDHSLALISDGSVVSWTNSSGATLTVPTLTGVVQISANRHHSMALKSDGTVVAWNTSGASLQVPATLTSAIAISAGYDSKSFAVKPDGTVVGWTATTTTSNALTIPSGLSNVVALSSGWVEVLALKSDGSAQAWRQSDGTARNVPAGLVIKLP